DGAAGLGGPADADAVDAGEVGRVEGEPVVGLGEADVLAAARVRGLLDLDTRVTGARRAGQTSGLGEVLGLLALGLEDDDLLGRQRVDARRALVGVGHREDAEDVRADVPGVARHRHRTLATEVLAVWVGVVAVAEGRLDDDALAVDLAVLGVGDVDLVLDDVTE